MAAPCGFIIKIALRWFHHNPIRADVLLSQILIFSLVKQQYIMLYYIGINIFTEVKSLDRHKKRKTNSFQSGYFNPYIFHRKNQHQTHGKARFDPFRPS